MSNLNNMMKQAQQMQQDMAKAQGELAETELVYEGNGVKVTVTGDMAVKKVDIDQELVDSKDKEMLEDVILVAINAALTSAREETEKQMSGITGGLNIPGLF
ncbi:MAG: YbaB/EbfC family nucleoid-associated protein [Lentisphaeria bacterium]|nr:YbaB/EbfC family nucleoid-associated protein [Lentisphaeria bacterium]